MHTHMLRRAVSRNAVMGTLAGLLLLVAIAIYWKFGASGAEDAPTDASSYTYYVCEGCGEYFHLDGAEVDRAMTRRETRSSASGRGLMFKCKKCGEIKAVRAGKCPQHGDVIKFEPGPNDPAKCSKCDFSGS